MPEGDTIYRAAQTLRRALAGRRIDAWRSDLTALVHAPIVGATVSDVEARGKHLLVRFEDGRTLHTHMMMSGSWHVYRPGERWRKSGRVDAMLETADWVAVCFDAPICELCSAGREPELVRRLGPDLLASPPDYDEAVRRLAASGLPLGVAVMTQRLVSGIGNVYKSEVLFLERLDPFVEVGEIAPEALRAALKRAARLMRQNLGGGQMRTTRRRFGGGRLWVYGRSGEPCYECGGTVRMRRQGEQGRSTYYCESCQGTSI